VRERAFLRAMRLVIGVIEVEHKSGGRLGGAGDAVVDHRVGEPGEVLAVDAVFKTRKGGSTRQVLRGLQGGRSTLSFNRGSCRRLLASLPSAYPEAIWEIRWAKRSRRV
jgi:hypothetical protein